MGIRENSRNEGTHKRKGSAVFPPSGLPQPRKDAFLLDHCGAAAAGWSARALGAAEGVTNPVIIRHPPANPPWAVEPIGMTCPAKAYQAEVEETA